MRQSESHTPELGVPTVFLVGAGPGDPELLTVKALRLLREAEVVVYDRLISQDVVDLIPTGTARIYAGKASGAHARPQDETNELLVSFRNQNQIMTISRDSSEVTRTFGDDGDYTLTSGTWFKGQHQACLSPDGILTVFDNRYPSADSLNSRVVQYQIDEETKTAEQIWEVDLGHRYRSGGEASVLPNGHLRITAGGARRSEGATVQVLEYDENQELIWHVELPSDDIPMVFRSSQISAGQLVDR